MICTRPDLAFTLSCVSKSSSRPGTKHSTSPAAIKRVFRYLGPWNIVYIRPVSWLPVSDFAADSLLAFFDSYSLLFTFLYVYLLIWPGFLHVFVPSGFAWRFSPGTACT